MTTVVINGFGPHIRFKSAQSAHRSVSGQVRVVTNSAVKNIKLTDSTDLMFHQAA